MRYWWCGGIILVIACSSLLDDVVRLVNVLPAWMADKQSGASVGWDWRSAVGGFIAVDLYFMATGVWMFLKSCKEK